MSASRAETLSVSLLEKSHRYIVLRGAGRCGL
jgi:hypothetical protein